MHSIGDIMYSDHTLSKFLEGHLLHAADSVSLKVEKRFVGKQLNIVLALGE